MASSLFQASARTPQRIPNRPTGGIDPQMVQQITQTMNALKGLKNPQQALIQAAQNNPQLNAVMQMCQGRNPQDVFMEQCKRNGVDPNAAMQQIRQMLS